jgi:tRNA pseudouridine65 synthase
LQDSPEQLLSILYRDDQYIAINKPPGLLVHRSEIDAQESRFAMQLLRDQIGQRVFPVHRLDKPTSGALLFATDEDAMIRAKNLFESKRVGKRYEAIVRGFTPESGHIDHALRKLLDRGPKKKSDETQEASTDYRRLSQIELPFPSGAFEKTRYSRMELAPSTGRRHQLRRHMAHINCPIIGDTRHGDTKQNRSFRERFGFCRLFLHATGLIFEHPISKETIRIEAPLWPDYRKALELTGLVPS